MSDSTDGGKVVDGTNGTANPDGSNQDNGAQDSIAVSETAKQILALQKQVETLTRSLQSDKDKAVAKTNQRIDGLEKDLKSVLQSALQKGQSVQDVLGEIEAGEELETRKALAEFARAFKEGKISTSVSGGTGQAGVDATKVLSELELDETDTRVQAFRLKQFSSEAEAYREAAKLVKQITTQPSNADLPSSVSRAKTADEQTKLMQEYEQKSKTLRGNALIQLKMEMRKKGLNVY